MALRWSNEEDSDSAQDEKWRSPDGEQVSKDVQEALDDLGLVLSFNDNDRPGDKFKAGANLLDVEGLNEDSARLYIRAWIDAWKAEGKFSPLCGCNSFCTNGPSVEFEGSWLGKAFNEDLELFTLEGDWPEPLEDECLCLQPYPY